MQAIVAVSQSWGIGKDGRLLFRLSADLRRFKALTTGHTVVMGRKTLQSLPGGKGQPNRRNLVLSRRMDYAPENAEVVTSVEALLRTAGEDAFVIGGQQVYEQLLPHCERVHVTKVLADAPADAFFPNLDEDDEWEITGESDEQTYFDLEYQFVKYERKK